MNVKKTHKGNLNIGKNIVSLDTNIIYQGIEIDYIGTINITSLLPNNYIVSYKNNKIIIIKLIKNNENILDLFSYKGLAIISKCTLVTKDLKKHNLFVNKSNIETYDRLNGNWESSTRNYQDLDFDGNNNKKSYVYKRYIKDEDTNTTTQIREIRKK